jgi:hypothetical protein
MSATKTSRTRARRRERRRKTARRPARGAAKPAAKAAVKPAVKLAGRIPPAPPAQVLYRLCKPGWAVLVEKSPHAQGTRFLCPFCPLSHRVPGPVRGFRKMRKAPWIRLRRVEE